MTEEKPKLLGRVHVDCTETQPYDAASEVAEDIIVLINGVLQPMGLEIRKKELSQEETEEETDEGSLDDEDEGEGDDYGEQYELEVYLAKRSEEKKQ